MLYYHFTPVSSNSKTGPIPVTTSGRATCPLDCPFYGNGCYGENFHLRMHWELVSSGERGESLDAVCGKIRRLPTRQLWRWAQAGDLPGDGTTISAPDLGKIVRANRRKRGFTFTHYDSQLPDNASAIREATANGFTVNLSANNLEHADALYSSGVGPVVVVLPAGTTKPVLTPQGRFVAICPATQRDDVTCSNCGICAHPTRKAIMGFPAHGSGAKKVQRVFFMSKI